MPSSLPPPPPGWDAAKYKLAYCFSAAHPQESSKPRFSSHVGRRSPLCGRENEPATHPISPAQHGMSAIHTPCPSPVRFPGQLRAPRPTVMARMRLQKQNATMFFFSRPHSIRQIANRIAKLPSVALTRTTRVANAFRLRVCFLGIHGLAFFVSVVVSHPGHRKRQSLFVASLRRHIEKIIRAN
jgi:hypothetical protein